MLWPILYNEILSINMKHTITSINFILSDQEVFSILIYRFLGHTLYITIQRERENFEETFLYL